MQELVVDFITSLFDDSIQLLEFAPTVLAGPPDARPPS